MKILNGTTRKCILLGKYAIKIPQFSYGWKTILYGLLGNMQEKQFSCLDNTCPILFYIPGGFLSIMPRCGKLTREQFNNINKDDFEFIPVENKIDSFGIYNGNIVAIDYG